MPPQPEPVLLFLDVDGPLIPFSPPKRSGTRVGHTPPPDSNPLLANVNRHHGPRLLSLDCTLIWATSWRDEANSVISPLLGLPRLPVVDWPEDPDQDKIDAWHGLHWKTRHLIGWAAGRTFIWIDDEHTEADQTWVRTHHRGDALLRRIDPHEGLSDTDFAAVGNWLSEFTQPARSAAIPSDLARGSSSTLRGTTPVFKDQHYGQCP